MGLFDRFRRGKKEERPSQPNQESESAEQKINGLTEEVVESTKKLEEDLAEIESNQNAMVQQIGNAPGSRAMQSMVRAAGRSIEARIKKEPEGTRAQRSTQIQVFRDGLRVESVPAGMEKDEKRRAEAEEVKFEPGTVGAMMYEVLGKERWERIYGKKDGSEHPSDDAR